MLHFFPQGDFEYILIFYSVQPVMPFPWFSLEGFACFKNLELGDWVIWNAECRQLSILGRLNAGDAGLEKEHGINVVVIPVDVGIYAVMLVNPFQSLKLNESQKHRGATTAGRHILWQVWGLDRQMPFSSLVQGLCCQIKDIANFTTNICCHWEMVPSIWEGPLCFSRFLHKPLLLEVYGP